MYFLYHFTKTELQCKCCGEFSLAPGFDLELSFLRKRWNKPIIVNSCCRCLKHNEKIGGNPRSLHLTENHAHNTGGTCAVDVSRSNMTEDAFNEFVLFVRELGWSTGIAKTFIHIDRRIDFGMTQALYYYK